MGGIETFFVTVGAALVGGLAIMTLRKPGQYRRLFPYLSAVAYSVLLLSLAYRIGGEQVWNATKGFTDDRLMAAFDAKEAVLPETIWIVSFFLGSMIYLLALKALPIILGIRDDGDDEDNKKQKD